MVFWVILVRKSPSRLKFGNFARHDSTSILQNGSQTYFHQNNHLRMTSEIILLRKMLILRFSAKIHNMSLHLVFIDESLKNQNEKKWLFFRQFLNFNCKIENVKES